MARVLLVDDDLDLVEALAAWLDLRGHEVRTASEGRAAVEAVRQFDPDLVLLDGVLDGTTGAAVAGELRAAGCRRIVFCTALPPRDLPPGTPVLAKPFRLESLEAVLNEPG